MVAVTIVAAESLLMPGDVTVDAASAVELKLEVVFCPEINDDGCSPSSKKSRRPVQIGEAYSCHHLAGPVY